MHKYLLLFFFTFIALVAPKNAQSATIADFESSIFYKKETLISKNPPYELKIGGRNNSYSFRDTENANSSFGVTAQTSIRYLHLIIPCHHLAEDYNLNSPSLCLPTQIRQNPIDIPRHFQKPGQSTP